MSASVGAWTPCSSLLTRVKCHPRAAASARPVSPASRRSSRRRTPSASCACLAELDGLVVMVRNRVLPHGVERPAAQLEVGGVGRAEPVNGQAVSGVEQEDDQPVIEEVEVVARHPDGGHESPWYPADVLAGG